MRALKSAALGMTPARFLTERMQRQFPAFRWKTVDGCVDDQLFFPSTESERSTFRSNMGLAECDKLVLFAGRLEPAKGTQVLKDLCASPRRDFAVLVQYPAWEEIREKKNLFTRYENICDELSAYPNVYFHADGDPRSQPRPVRFADVFVSPSLSEVQPLVLLEALASGIPFVGTASTPDYAELRHRFRASTRLSSAIETIELPDDLNQGAVPRWPGKMDLDCQPIANALVETINKKVIPDDRSRTALSREFLDRGFRVSDRILKFRHALDDPGLHDVSPENAGLEDALL
jgi:1,2-diacylglycerol-3-alpha-glucose alpha-1,2-glucosyltransferase